jgi:hypothetical protein
LPSNRGTALPIMPPPLLLLLLLLGGRHLPISVYNEFGAFDVASTNGKNLRF